MNEHFQIESSTQANILTQENLPSLDPRSLYVGVSKCVRGCGIIKNSEKKLS